MTAAPIETVDLPLGLRALLFSHADIGPPAPKPPSEPRNETPEHARRRRRVAGAERSRRLYDGGVS
jgi:hypothetical protein